MGLDPTASWWWSWGWKPDLLACFEEVAWPGTMVSHSFSFPQELHACGEIRKRRMWSGEKEDSSGWSWVALVPQSSQTGLMSLTVALRRLRSAERGVKMVERRGCVPAALEPKTTNWRLGFAFQLCRVRAVWSWPVPSPLWNSAFSSTKGWLNELNDVMLVKGLLYSSCSIKAFSISDLCFCFKVRSEVTLPWLKCWTQLACSLSNLVFETSIYLFVI